MTRNCTSSLMIALLLAASAFGQSPYQTTASEAGLPIAFASDRPNGGLIAQPLSAVASTGESGDLWGNVDYLLGFLQGNRLPPLVTTSPDGTARSSAGVLGQPGTRILFGNSASNDQARSGLRANGGFWCDPDKQFGIEAGILILGGGSNNFSSSSNGSQILARPFIDLATGRESSSISGFPSTSTGSITASAVDHRLYTGTIDLRSFVWTNSWIRIDSLLGYRYLQFEDRLAIQQIVQPTAGPFAAGTTIQSNDSFRSKNRFNGADIGMRVEFLFEDLSLELLAKVSGGVLTHKGDINGSQVVTVPGVAPVTNAGGLLALSSNIGSTTDTTATLVPEVGATLGWQISPNFRLRLGYTTLLLPNVIRSSDQVDRVVNSALIPPATAQVSGAAARPALTPTHSDLWLNAVSAGIELRY